MRATLHLQESHGALALTGEIRIVVVAHRHRRTITRAACSILISRRIGAYRRRVEEVGRGEFRGPIPGKVRHNAPNVFLGK